MTPEKMIQ